MHILSLGTGGGGFELKGKSESQGWNLLKWAKSIPDIMMDGAIDTVAFQMQEIFNTLAEEHRSSYFRLDVPQLEDEDEDEDGVSEMRKREWDKEFRDYSADMTDASDENIRKLLAAGEKTLNHWRLKGLDGFLDGMVDLGS